MKQYEVICDHDNDQQDAYGDFDLEEAIATLADVARRTENLNWIQIQVVT